jgi:hypothetical protein
MRLPGWVAASERAAEKAFQALDEILVAARATAALALS